MLPINLYAAAYSEELVREHHVFYAVIVLGILTMLALIIIHALGFSALGPFDGKFSL